MSLSRPGDWSCRSCNHLNFQRRDSCQKCGDPRQSGGIVDYSTIFGGGRSLTGGVFATGPDVRPGDWYCSVRNCGAHNFANRSNCFKCGALKEEQLSAAGGGYETDFGRGRGLFGSSGSGRNNGWKSGDWLCNRTGCNEHNFANRMECFRCNAPRDQI